MTRWFLTIMFVVGLSSLRCLSQNPGNDKILREIIKQYDQAEVTIPYSDKETADILTRNVSILSVVDKVIIVSLSSNTVEWFINQRYDYRILEKNDRKGIVTARTMTEAMEWNSYPTYSQYDSVMQSFISLYPSLCQLDTIGTSINGKLILAIKISGHASGNEDDPEVFYTSTIHGDETGGFVLLLRLIDYLLYNYNLDARVKHLVDNLQIWINPLANPDGTYGTGNTISSSTTRYNANGFDLNRNFPDPDPLFPDPVIQKETIDMIRFMREHRFVISANFHSGAEVVNYPWDRWKRLHADNDWFYNISRKYADTVHLHSPAGYMVFLDDGVTNGYDWYSIYGGRQDFVTYELNGREVTVELDNDFITPADELPGLWQYNWRSLLGYLENALHGIHGLVQDSHTSEPVAARIFITGHDKDSSNIYSDNLTGRFVRLLAPGIWDLNFSAPGYYDETVSNISVVQDQKTDIVVSMVPIINNTDSLNPGIPILYPNPASENLKAVLPQGIRGTVNIKIFSLSGKVISEFDTETVDGTPVNIDINQLNGGVYTIVFRNINTNITCRGRFIVIK